MSEKDRKRESAKEGEKCGEVDTVGEAMMAAIQYAGYLRGRLMSMPGYPIEADLIAEERFYAIAFPGRYELKKAPIIKPPSGPAYCFEHAELHCVLCGNY